MASSSAVSTARMLRRYPRPGVAPTTFSTVTAEKLFGRPDLNPCELVDGQVVPRTPASFHHGEIESETIFRLASYAQESGRGLVAGGEVGIVIRRDPDTVRAADVLFISHERLGKSAAVGYLQVAPELVVEILSPDDRWSEVKEKLHDYFAAGVDRVWVLDPRVRKVFSYRSLSEVETFDEDQILTDDELLPGFEVVVAELFG